MANKTIYKLTFVIAALLYMGCRESMHYDDVFPALHPRYLRISEKELYAPSSNTYSTTLSVYSENTPWTFDKSPSWLSLNPSKGNSEADVTMVFTENLSADTSRYAVFFFSDDVDDWDYRIPISVNQPAVTPYLRLSTDYINASGGVNRQEVTIYSNAHWRAESSASWVKVDKADSLLLLSFSDNQTGEYRTAHVTVEASHCSEIIVVSQAPAKAETSVNELVFDNTAVSATFSITSETSWIASASDSWLQVSPDEGQAGTTEVTIDLAPNMNVSERNGYITFRCNNITELLTMKVVQKGLYLETDTDELVFGAQPCSREIVINSNVDWAVTYCPQWATPTITEGQGNATFSVQVEENVSTYERSGYMLIESPGLNLSKRIQLTQHGKSFEMGTTVMEFSDKASTNTVDIITDGAWEAHCNVDWVILSPYMASGNSVLSVSVTENTSDNERIAFVNVTVSDKTIELTVRQQGKFLSLDESQLVIPSKGGSVNVYVNTNDSWEARLEDASEWLSLSTAHGDGAVDVTVTATDNASVNERTDILSITTKNNLAIQLPIRQEARYLKVNMTDILFFARGGTSDVVTIETNGAYKISQTGDWFALSRSGNSFTVIATENRTNGWREGSITITLTDLTEGSYEVVIPVKQVQVGCSFTLSGYGQDNNQDDTNGGGTLENGGYHDDVSWDASSGGLTISLQSYTVDNNWNANTTNSFTVVVTGYKNDKDWSNNGLSDTALGKDGFNDDGSHDATNGTDSTLGKEDYNNDNNHDTSNATNTTLERKGFGADNNWNE